MQFIYLNLLQKELILAVSELTFLMFTQGFKGISSGTILIIFSAFNLLAFIFVSMLLFFWSQKMFSLPIFNLKIGKSQSHYLGKMEEKYKYIPSKGPETLKEVTPGDDVQHPHFVLGRDWKDFQTQYDKRFI